MCSAGFFGPTSTLVTHNVAAGSWAVQPTVPATSCSACAATFYSYAGSPACAQCSLTVSAFASPQQPCQPFRFSALNSALVFYHSGDSVEGLGPFDKAASSPAFVADRLGFASSALNFSGPASYLSLKQNAIASLPSGNAAASLAFWVSCPPTASPVSAVEWGVPVDVSAQRFAAMLGTNAGTAAAPGPAPAQIVATKIVAVAGAASGVSVAPYGDGVGTAASFFGGYAAAALNAGHAAFDATGTLLYYSDTGAHKIRRLNVVTGQVVTIAGGGASGYSGGAGTWIEGPGATTALFNSPRGLVVDPKSGKIYVADTGNNAIRLLTPTASPDAYTVSTYAGGGYYQSNGRQYEFQKCMGYGCFDGDGTAAQFTAPAGLAMDSAGNMYVAESFRIRYIDIYGVVSTLAGNTGTGYVNGPSEDAKFGCPTTASCAPASGLAGIALDAAGNVYVADFGASAVRKLDVRTWTVSTVLGAGSFAYSDGMVGTNATIGQPVGVAFDASGALLVSDPGRGLVYKLSVDSGIVHTLAGSGVATAGAVAAVADGAVATSVAVMALGLAISPTTGSLFFFDSRAARVRALTFAAAAAPVCDNRWHHVAITHGDGSADAHKLYVDGVLLTTQMWRLYTAAGSSLKIGSNGQGGDVFAGSLDDIRVYSQALRASQVGSLYAVATGYNGGMAAPLTPGNIVLLTVGNFNGLGPDLSDDSANITSPTFEAIAQLTGYTYIAEVAGMTGQILPGQMLEMSQLPIPQVMTMWSGGSGPSEGIMTVSYDQKSLIFGTYNAPINWNINNAPLGTTWSAPGNMGASYGGYTQNPATVPQQAQSVGLNNFTFRQGSQYGYQAANRVFTRLDGDGRLYVVSQTPDLFQGDTSRSACSYDGTQVYATGHGMPTVDPVTGAGPTQADPYNAPLAGPGVALLYDGFYSAQPQVIGNNPSLYNNIWTSNGRACAISPAINGVPTLYVSQKKYVAFYEVVNAADSSSITSSTSSPLPSLPGLTGSYTVKALPGFPDATFSNGAWLNNFLFQDANNIWAACSNHNNQPVPANSKGYTFVAGVHHYARANAAANFALVGVYVGQTAIDLTSFMCGPHFMLLVTIYDYYGVNGTQVITFNTTDNSWVTFTQDDLTVGSGRGIQFRGVAFVPGTDTTSGCANLAGLQCSKYCAPKPFKSTSLMALRTDSTLLPYASKGCSASTMVVPAYFDEIDISTGRLVQSIPVPQLMSPVTQAPSAANMYPMFPPIGQFMPPPPFVSNPYDIRQAQSVGITSDATEGGGGTSWDGCYFTFIGYEAYTYTSGNVGSISRATSPGTIVPATSCKAMDAGSSYMRTFVTIDGNGRIDASQRSLAMLGGIDTPTDYYHQPRCGLSDGLNYWTSGDGGIESFRIDEGGSDYVPDVAFSLGDDNMANFHTLYIGPPGPGPKNFFAMSHSGTGTDKFPNGTTFPTYQCTGWQDMGAFSSSTGGLQTPYDIWNKPGCLIHSNVLNSLPAPLNAANAAGMSEPYCIYPVDSSNIWVGAGSTGLYFYQEQPSSVPGYRNYTLSWGPERPPSVVTGQQSPSGQGTYDCFALNFAPGYIAAGLAPAAAWVTSALLNRANIPVLAVTQRGSYAATGGNQAAIWRFDPTQAVYSKRWTLISRASKNTMYRAIGAAPQAKATCNVIPPPSTVAPCPPGSVANATGGCSKVTGPNGGFPQALTPGNIVILTVGNFNGLGPELSDDSADAADPNFVAISQLTGYTYVAEVAGMTGNILPGQIVEMSQLPIPQVMTMWSGASGPSEGILTTSYDNRFLVFGTYNAPLSWNVNNAPGGNTGSSTGVGLNNFTAKQGPPGYTAANRVLTRLGADGQLFVVSQTPDLFQGDTVRSACSYDGNELYVFGHGMPMQNPYTGAQVYGPPASGPGTAEFSGIIGAAIVLPGFFSSIAGMNGSTPGLMQPLLSNFTPGDSTNKFSNARACVISSAITGKPTLYFNTKRNNQAIYEMTNLDGSHITNSVEGAAPTMPGFGGYNSGSYTGTVLAGFPDTTFVPTAIGAFGTQSDWMNNFVFQDANNIWAACSFQNNISVLPNSKGFNMVAGVHHYQRSVPDGVSPFSLVGVFVNQTAIDLSGFKCGPHFMLLVTIYDYNGVNGASVITFNTTDNSWSYFLQDDLTPAKGRGVQFRGVAFVPGTDTTSGCANLAGLQCSKYCAPKPFKSTSMLALRLDATALPYNALGCTASRMVVPAYFDEIDVATGALVQSIPVPQLMSPVTQAPSAANMYPVFPPIGKQTLPPPFVTDPYDIRQAQSVGITIDNSEGGGGTSWDGCFFTFIGYEAYSYSTGNIGSIVNGTIVPATTCTSLDAGSNYSRTFVTIDGNGKMDLSQRSEAMMGGNTPTDYYHQPRFGLSDGFAYYGVGDGGIEFFRIDEGNVDNVPDIASSSSDDGGANFNTLFIGPAGSNPMHMYALSKNTLGTDTLAGSITGTTLTVTKMSGVDVGGWLNAQPPLALPSLVAGTPLTGAGVAPGTTIVSGSSTSYIVSVPQTVPAGTTMTYTTYQCRGVQDLGGVNKAQGGLLAPYNSVGKTGCIIHQNVLPTLIVPAANTATLTGAYCIYPVDDFNIWVGDQGQGLYLFQDVGSSIPGYRNFTQTWGPEKAPNLAGVAAYGTSDCYAMGWSAGQIAAGTAPAAPGASAALLNRAAVPVLAVTYRGTYSATTPNSAIIYRFDPSQPTYALRWKVISVSSKNNLYRAIGKAPLSGVSGSCFQISPTPTPSPSTTPSCTPSASMTVGASTSSTPSPTPTQTPSLSTTSTMTSTPSTTSTMTSTPSPTPTSSLSPGAAPSISSTPTPSQTPSSSSTLSLSPTATVTPSMTVSLSAAASVSPTATVTPSMTVSLSAAASASPSLTSSATITPSVTPVGDALLVFSFSFVPTDGSIIVASALAASPAVLSSVSANVASAMGVPASTVKVANVTDIATGAVSRALGARRLAGAAGSAGVSFTVVVNLGKTATAASVAAKQAALLANFNATSPAVAQIKGDVAVVAGVQAASLSAVPPSPASISLSGNAAGLAPVVVVVQGGGQDVSGVLAADEGIGAAIGGAMILIAIGLYAWRSKIVHGALPWQRDRKRELFELKSQAAKEAEDRITADMVPTTVVNPAATSGKAALTLRVPRAVAIELEAERSASAAKEARVRSLEARVKEMELADAAASRPAAQQSPAANFAPTPVGATSPAAGAPPPSAAAPPSVWREVKDPNSGRSYWFHTVTKQTTWTRPAGM